MAWEGRDHSHELVEGREMSLGQQTTVTLDGKKQVDKKQA